MTAAPRRRRHDPLPPAGAGRVEPPGPVDDRPAHPHDPLRRRPRAGRARRGGGRGRRPPPGADRPRHARRLPRGRRRRRRPGRADARPGRRDQRDRHPRPRPVGGRAAHPRLRDGPGRRGLRGDPRRPARPAPRAVRADGRAAARARPADRRRSSPTSASSRRRRARPPDRRPRADRGRPRDERRGRLRAAARLGQARRTCRATGLGPVEAIEAIRAAGGLPVLAHFGEAPARVEVVRELVDAGLGGLEVYYRSFDVGDGRRGRRGRRRRSASSPTGGSDYHGDTGTYAEAHAGLWVPPEVAAGIPGAGVGVGSPAQP